MKWYLAVDLGASSGRIIAGRLNNNRIETVEVHRFSNEIVDVNGQLHWDADRLFSDILEGLKKSATLGSIQSVGVDTWGVDYVLLNQDGEALAQPFAYRDDRTDGMPEKLEKTLPFSEHYAMTGTGRQNYNTVYQMMSDPLVQKAANFLLMPEYFSYLLSGTIAHEYTISTTTGMLNINSKQWDDRVLSCAGIPEALFKTQPLFPGSFLGKLKSEISDSIGFSCEVCFPCCHDTGSAFMAVPAEDSNSIFISSGTWSMVGIERDQPTLGEIERTSGFTNEGLWGGRVRTIKNIMGLWLVQELRRNYQNKYSYAEMAQMAADADPFPATIDVNDPRFMAPAHMEKEILSVLKENNHPLPKNDAQMIRLVFQSLAESYANAIEELSIMSGNQYTAVHIVGGGCLNRTLNQLTANACQLPVYAGPSEGTALGNLMAQMLADKTFSCIDEARSALKNSIDVSVFYPEH